MRRVCFVRRPEEESSTSFVVDGLFCWEECDRLLRQDKILVLSSYIPRLKCQRSQESSTQDRSRGHVRRILDIAINA
jgi:hypothetical protein